MNPKRTLTLALLLFLMLSSAFYGCVRLPTGEPSIVTMEPEETRPTPQATKLAPDINTDVNADTAPPTIKETRRLILEWPATMRKGDADLIRITLEIDEDGDITPTVEIEGHESKGEKITIPDLYDSHIVKVKPQLNLSGISFTPSKPTEKTLRRGENLSFYWSINPSTEGDFFGTASLQLSFTPKDGGNITTISLADQIFKIKVRTLFGMSGRTARLVGWSFSLLGAIFSFDDIVKFLKKQFETKKNDST